MQYARRREASQSLNLHRATIDSPVGSDKLRWVTRPSDQRRRGRRRAVRLLLESREAAASDCRFAREKQQAPG
jgi:hypothetical protein